MQKRILFVVISFLVLLGVSFFSALPAHAVIYVSNSVGNSITTWPDNTTGNIAPTTNITGASTTLNYPRGVAVDGSWIYVANTNNNSVDVFPIGATGDVAPTRSIQGASTTLNRPAGIAVTAQQQQAPTAVPTMNEWGMIVFMLLAGLGSVWAMRRGQRA